MLHCCNAVPCGHSNLQESCMISTAVYVVVVVVGGGGVVAVLCCCCC